LTRTPSLAARELIVALTTHHRLPAIYPFRAANH
jgi:hypothetical protein